MATLSPLVSRVGACWPFQGYPRHAHACTAFGLFLLSTKARMQIQTTKEIRCLPCFSAVNGKELSSCLSEIFHFFSLHCLHSQSWQLYLWVSSTARCPLHTYGKWEIVGTAMVAPNMARCRATDTQNISGEFFFLLKILIWKTWPTYTDFSKLFQTQQSNST